VNELFPFVSGVALGLLVGVLRPSLRLGAGALLAVLLGFAATVVSGEFRIGWEYLLIDIPLVGASAFMSFAITRKIVLRRRYPPEEGAAG
jgi:hypothetical protein